jgi:type IV pilus assembly protein PilQ
MYARAENLIITGVWLALFGLCFAGLAVAAQPNRVQNVVLDGNDVVIETMLPVDGEYAVYDSVDPTRIVIDFSEVAIENSVFPPLPDSHPFVRSFRASSFDLSSGRMGRIEILLAQAAEYDVESLNNGLRLRFRGAKAVSDPGSNMPLDASGDSPAAAADDPVVEVPEVLAPASVIGAVQVSDGRVALVADGEITNIKHFYLTNPTRFVVDVHQIRSGFDQRAYALSGGFSKLRVGVEKDKLRFVFDADKGVSPEARLLNQGNVVQIQWGNAPTDAPPVKPVAEAPAPLKRVEISAVEFRSNQGQSILTVALSGPAKIYAPERHGEIVRFGVGNATISRSLRRSIDASAFPSAVRLVTPYLTRKDNRQDVWFAVEFKGQVPYALRQDGNRLLFVVDDGPYAEAAPRSLDKQVIPVVSAGPLPAPQVGVEIPTIENDAFDSEIAPGYLPRSVVSLAAPAAKPRYTGQKVSLAFDDANIRNILQLIAEVSNLNIIASDDVKGTITLRLVEVPWDQALDLIMDIKDLGMLREGNVVRVMPREKIRQMQEERFKAARTKEELEDLVTETMIVSYSDIKTVAEQLAKRKTDRGKIIEDTRNKRIIVTDIPSVVAEIRNLVALLDVPVKQVLIEARIVEASATFARDLGVKWGASYSNDPSVAGNDGSIGLGGSYLLAPPTVGDVASAAGLASGLTFGRVGLDKAVLDLRISALESSGQGRIISTPRVTTINGEEAEISQGTEIPYQSLGSDGMAKTEFKKAELSLKVTPEINPDGSVILEIEAKNDSRGAAVVTGSGSAIAIDTKKAETTVLVKDGETTVIGGIFIQDKQESEDGVPFLRSVPILGHLFKSRSVSEERRELLVFITPRILD